MTVPTEHWHGVYLGTEHVGDLVQRGDHTRFLFTEDYWDREDRAVLGLWFEEHTGESPETAMVLPAWFSNLLPEGRLREWIARDRGVLPNEELALLLRIGRDLPGAVSVQEQGTARPGEWLTEVGDVDHADRSPALKFSLAGVGMKFSMLQSGDRLVLPAHGGLGDWIVKLPDAAYSNIPSNEAAMMTLAGSAGIEVPEHRLISRAELPELPEVAWPSKETVAYAVRRFDRRDGERVHIEDFAQVRGKSPLAKYVGTFETVAALCYRGSDRRSLQEWARRVAFNIAIGNGDAHLKNWSMIYPDGKRATLAPAYDLVSTVEHIPGDGLGMKFTGTESFAAVKPSGFAAVENRLDATGADLETCAAETVQAVADHAQDLSDIHPDVADTLTWVAKNARRVQAQLRL